MKERRLEREIERERRDWSVDVEITRWLVRQELLEKK